MHVPQPAQLEPMGFAESSAAAVRLALASTADLVFEIRRDGTVADANDSACTLLGYTRGELNAMPWTAIDADAAPPAVAGMFDALAAGHRWRAEARLRTARGDTLPVDIVAQRVEVDGREHCFLFAREVVERKRIEAALAESAERFRSLFEDSPVPELLLDANFRIVQVNRAACALLGYPGAELIGRDPALLLHPDEIEAGLKLREHLARGAVVSAESDRRMVRSDGRTVWVRLTVRAWAIGESARRYVLVLEDFSDRRAASERLEQALRRSRTLLETMSVGVAQALDGKVLLANREFTRLFGYSESETVGLPLEELTRDRANRAPNEVSMLPAARPDEPAQAEVVLFRKDGTPVWCLVQARVVDAGAEANELGTDAIYAFLDVSEHKRSREALGRSLLELNVVLDTTSAAVLHLADGQVARGNAQAVALFDGDAAGPVGRRFEDLFEDAAVLGDDWRARLAELAPNAARTFEAKMRRADGEVFWALVSLRAVDAERPADAQVASILDISERRRQQERLERLASESQLLFDTAVVGLLFVRDGRPVRANAAIEQLLGCERGALTRGGELFAHPADSLLMSGLAERFGEIDQRGACDFEMRLYRRNGNPTWVAVQGRAVDAREPAAGYIFAFVDIDARKRSEAHLRDALAELQRIFDNALVGVAYAANDALVKANAATVRMFGYSAEQLAQLAIGALFVRPHEWDEARARAASAGEVNFEHELKRVDGSTFWAAGNVRLLDTGAPERGMIVALMNVDARKRSEQELQRVRNYLDLIVENLPVLVSVRESGSGRFVSLNRAGEAITGRPRDQVIGRTWHDLYDAALADEFAALDRDALDRGQLLDRPRALLPRADGRTLTVHQRVMPLYEDDAGDGQPRGRAQYVMSIVDDLTDTVRAEAALRETDARFRQLAENIDQVVFIATDDFSRVLYVSPRYEELVGAAVPELLDDVRHFYRYVHAPDLPELARRLPRLIASMRRGRRTEVTLAIDHPRRGTRTLLARLSPVRMFDGSIRVFGIAEDITERMAAEAKRLDEAVRQRDLLVREVHHRIKNNLQGVAGLLQHQAHAKPELAENLNEIAGQIQAIAQVHGLQLRATGTLPMLGVAQGIFTNLGGMFGVAVNFEAPAAALWRWGLPENEAVPLALVINELGTNAIKYRGSREQGIAVRMLPRAAGVELRIENTGRLPEGFEMARITSGVSGLGLVKALLPRRGARLSIEQLGPLVISRLDLGPPAIREEMT